MKVEVPGAVDAVIEPILKAPVKVWLPATLVIVPTFPATALVVPVTVKAFPPFTNDPVPVISKLPPIDIVPPEFTVPFAVMLKSPTLFKGPAIVAEVVEPNAVVNAKHKKIFDLGNPNVTKSDNSIDDDGEGYIIEDDLY